MGLFSHRIVYREAKAVRSPTLHVCIPERGSGGAYPPPIDTEHIRTRSFPEVNTFPSEWKGVALDALDAAVKDGVYAVATIEYVIIKWIELLAHDRGIKVMWHSWHDDKWHLTDDYYAMKNSISTGFSELFDAEIERSMNRGNPK